MKKDDVDDVVLVGGSTRIPKVQELLKVFFNGKELCQSINPDEAVAYGAAIQAAVLSGVRNNYDFTLVDVTPFSLGVKLHSGEMKFFIPRNTTIPVQMSDNIYTALENQTSISFPVYEGERPIAVDNNFLVSSQHIGNDNKKQITITNHSGRLSKDEIDRMIEEAKKYKAEDEEHIKGLNAKLALQHYAESLWDMVRVCWKKFQEEDAKKMKDAIEKTTQWLDWNFNLTEVSECEEKLKELKSILDPIIADMP